MSRSSAGVFAHIRSGSVATLVCLWMTAGCSHAVNPAVIEDAQTAVRVTTALVNDPELGLRAIEVRVSSGVARLSGLVWSDAEARRAVELAGAVPGVAAVESELRIRPPVEEPTAPPPLAPVARVLPAVNPPGPGLLAVGVSLGTYSPADGTLRGGWKIGPLVRFGSGSGLGLTLGMSWFHSGLTMEGGADEAVGRVTIRPLMIGLGYTLRRQQLSVSPSLVGGVAFNRFTLEQPTGGDRVPVAIDNSLAWRSGVAAWYDVSERIALNVFGGYVVTRPAVAYLEDGRVEKRPLRGDTLVLSAGMAYKLF